MAGRHRMRPELPPTLSGEFIETQVHAKLYDLTQHATMARQERGITEADIETALLNGKIIEVYDDDFPFPTCLVLGWRDTDRLLHVVCARVDAEPALQVVTVYEPAAERWLSDFKTRRMTR